MGIQAQYIDRGMIISELNGNAITPFTVKRVTMNRNRYDHNVKEWRVYRFPDNVCEFVLGQTDRVTVVSRTRSDLPR